MTELEKAEKLREKTGVSYTEAKEALDNTDGSLLDALVFLEKQGRVETPPGGGFYSGAGKHSASGDSQNNRKSYVREGESFSEMMGRFGKFLVRLFDKGLTNCLVAVRNGEHLFSLPVIAFILLLIFFWVTLPLFLISLFCGIRYRFEGPDLEKESINNVMDTASNMADDVKKTFTEEAGATKDAYEAEKENTRQDAENNEQDTDEIKQQSSGAAQDVNINTEEITRNDDENDDEVLYY